MVCTDNNPLTYIFSSANLNAAGQRWVAQLASYNFALEYQKGKYNTVADFLSCLDDRLTEGCEVLTAGFSHLVVHVLFVSDVMMFWGMVCETVREFFVRVLRSSESYFK